MNDCTPGNAITTRSRPRAVLNAGEVVTEPLVAALPIALTTRARRTVRLAELAALPARLPSRDENPVLAAAIDREGLNVQEAPTEVAAAIRSIAACRC